MILQPLARLGRVETSRTAIVPAPTGGWNARDSLDNLPANDAIKLDNWFPRERDVVMRNPYAKHIDTGETGSVVGLVAHEANETSKLIAFVAGKALDVTSGSASTLTTGLNSGAEVYGFNFVSRSYYCNGVDAVQTYDGTTFGASGLAKDAGESETIDLTAFTCGMGHRNRLYLAGDGKLGFWYGNSARAVTGAIMEYFPLDGVLTDGGSVVAVGSLTDNDGSAGRKAFSCFFSSKGQVAIYDGSDPGDATDYNLVGVYNVGKPINRFGVVNLGADLVVITNAGYIPLSEVLKAEAQRSARFALSDKIQEEAQIALQRFEGNSGWRAIVIPRTSKLVINVPRTALAFDQHVMNTVTRAWCRFCNIPATSMAVFGEVGYFGSTDGDIYLLEGEDFDDETTITAEAQTAWSYYNEARVKQFTQCQPVLVSNGTPFVQIGFAVDFGAHKDTGSIMAETASGVGVWDVGIWDTAIWSGIETAVTDWVGLKGVGYTGSLKVRAAEASAALAWKSTRVMYKTGAPR